MAKTGLERLPEGWAKIMATEYAEGAADVEVRARLKMTKKLWDTLYESPDQSEFKQIVDFGRMLSQAWWFTQARKNLQERAFNANLWYMVMKNRYGFSDKTTTTTKEAPDMTSDELDARIRKAFDKYSRVVKDG